MFINKVIPPSYYTLFYNRSQLASVDASQASRIAVMKQRILASLTEEESAEWKAAVAQAEADGTFFISTPHHCAVGIKPPVTVA